MKLGRAFLICILAVIPSPTALAQSGWTCTWPGFGNGGKPVIGRFKIVGNDVIFTNMLDERFRVLQDNKYGLVAVSSFSEIESNHREPSVGAYLIIIDKQTREFKIAAVTNREQNYAPSVGTCIPN